MTTPPKYEDLVLKVAGMERREAALIEDLKSEKILSKTFMGQKETFMKLYDAQRVELRECKAREAALREELSLITTSFDELAARVGFSEARLDQAGDSPIDCADQLQQRLTVAERRESEAREELLDLSRKLDVFYSRSHGIKNLSAIEDANDKSKALQQRLTVAEQRAGKMEELLREAYEAGDHNIFGTDLDSRIDAALKPAAEQTKICPNCNVCMGSADFPENCLINGVKP